MQYKDSAWSGFSTPFRLLIEVEHGGEKVFVFGREVNDFRVADDDANAMLNFSAPQELARTLEMKDAGIAVMNTGPPRQCS